MKTVPSAPLFLVVSFAVFVTTIVIPPKTAAATRQPKVINASGQELTSIFDGLKPNPVVLAAISKPWKGIRFAPLPGIRRVSIREGSCPASINCFGHFQSIVVSPGGCIVDACNPVFNSNTDLTAACQAGSQDIECGDGNGTCCADYYGCTGKFTQEGC